MKQSILSILQQAQRPVRRIELFWLLHARGIKTTDRAIRKAVEEMIEAGECIASSKDGYNLITDKKQLTAAVDYLRAKSKAIAVRGNFLIRNYRETHKSETLELELFT
jgi:repressor of nif and glnA expression